MDTSEMGKNRSIIRAILLIVLVVSSLAVYLYNPEPFQTLFQLLFRGDIAGSIHFIRSFGPYAILVSFLIVVFINTVAILPNIFILAANGVIFGVVKGTLISWIAESVGVIISFLLMRYLFRDYAQNIISRSNGLKKIDEISGKKGFRIMLVARSIPYVPSGLITAWGALSSICFSDYVLATFIGKLPGTWIEVTLGHDLLSYKEHMLRLSLLVVVSAIAYFLFARYQKKAN